MRGVRRLRHPQDGRGLTVALLDVPALMGEWPTGASRPAHPSSSSQLSSRAASIAEPGADAWLIERADGSRLDAYHRLRREAFVEEQGLFDGSDRDDTDDDPRTVVLVAVSTDGAVLGGVRLAPATADRDLGWWTGSRLVVARAARGGAGIGAALVRAAAAEAEARGVLRFEANVQMHARVLFRRLGWVEVGSTVVAGHPHALMRRPIDRIERAALAAKESLTAILSPFDDWADAHPASLGGAGFVGDDGAPVPGTDLIAACDAILPSMVERDPEWAGWCSVLVNVNDLTAMGARVVGLLDSLGARDEQLARRVLRGVRAGAQAWGAPLLGGHTQLGVPASLAVTALGRTDHPIPGGGGRVGHAVTVTADLGGDWRPGYTGRQWDSSSHRSGEELRSLAATVGAAAPAAAKDVSMAGLVGTLGMLAEASGCGATLDVAAVPIPAAGAATMGDWLTCFPGFAMITTDAPGEGRMSSPHASTAECGVLTISRGVRIRWPDGAETAGVPAAVTGLGPA